MTAPTLHVYGCGRAGRAIARRLHQCGAVTVGQIVNRSPASAMEAAAFIGAGQPRAQFTAGIDGQWLMLGLPDGALAAAVDELRERLPGLPALAFHLSGSAPAALLSPLGSAAAVHPLRAFADPELAVRQFESTWCVAEGEPTALSALRLVFERAGGRWLEFAARDKHAYHAATVVASNFLVTVQALARRLATAAGLEPAQAAELLVDLQRGTLQTLRDRPPKDALTGPIERGDLAACRRLQDAAMRSLSVPEQAAFNALGQATVALAVARRGPGDSDADLLRLFGATATSRAD
ncbi:MAG: DUF2520 domain-containing protein [Pseudomonadota bacterium]|nr:MAG: DUF2520 domain-containing protein [Pseudomonadota bacterium]